MLDLAVIIVSYNVRDLLRDCLKSALANQSLAFSVCVVDNDSPDRSADMVAAEFPQVHLIRNGNTGYPAGNNLGLRHFGFSDLPSAVDGRQPVTPAQRSGPFANEGVHNPKPEWPRYALLLNPDTVVPPNTFVRTVAYVDAHPDVGVLGVKLLLRDRSLDLACRRGFPTPEVSFYRFSGLSKLFPRSPRFGRYNMTFLDPDRTAEIDSTTGAFMLVRGTAIQQVGLLDETFWMYGEDLDWAFRMKRCGWRVLYYPEVTVLHIKRASSKDSPRAKYEFERALWLFYRKHYQPTTPRWLDGLVRMGIGLRGGRRLMREMNILPHGGESAGGSRRGEAR